MNTLHENLRYLWQYLAELSFEWEMFQKKICIEKIKSHFMFNNVLPKIVPLKRQVEKYCTAELAMDDNKIPRMRLACWIT